LTQQKTPQLRIRRKGVIYLKDYSTLIYMMPTRVLSILTVS
jgi:hypothetical protein